MSIKSKAVSNARGAAKAAGGSYLTREARMDTLGRVITRLFQDGMQVSGVDTLRERHISHYVAGRKAEGKSSRTLQNEAAHIRQSMRAEGRHQAASSQTISNAALGISGGSRKGTKQAPSEGTFATMLALAAQVDEALPVLLRMERHLGLRSQEAIRSGPTLRLWKRQLTSGVAITVIYGTKGGRRRETHVPNRDLALSVVIDALTIARKRGGNIVAKKTLEQAETWYRNAMNREVTKTTGFTGHALRYAFTHDSIARYVAQGFSVREARALTSMDLGHGDGRGRYIASVYGQGITQ